MNELKFYKYAAGGLLLLNLMMIAFFFLTPPTPPHLQQGKNFLKTATGILGLDEEQSTIFSQSAKNHRQQMEALNRQQHDLLKPYFNSLIHSNESTHSDSLLQQTLELERQKIEYTFQHFQEIKSILNEDQHTGFEHFMRRALNVIL